MDISVRNGSLQRCARGYSFRMARSLTLIVEDNFYDSVESNVEEYDVGGSEHAIGQEASAIDDPERARREQQLRSDLAKLDEEICTLKSVLTAKVAEAAELRRKLGLTTMVVLKEDIRHSLQAIKESDTVQKTNEKLSQLGESIAASDAYQKTNTALRSFGAYASRKMGDLKNSTAFKSVEGSVGGAYSSIKMRVGGSQSEDSFEDVLRRTKEQEQVVDTANSLTATTRPTSTTAEPQPS